MRSHQVEVPERFLPEGVSSAGFDAEMLLHIAQSNNHSWQDIQVKPWVLWYLVDQYLKVDQLARLGNPPKRLEATDDTRTTQANQPGDRSVHPSDETGATAGAKASPGREFLQEIRV